MRARDLFVVAIMTVTVACAAQQRTAEIGPVSGSTPALQPQIVSVVNRTNGVVELTVRLPRPGYITAFSILPGQSMALLTTTPGATAAAALGAGEHHLSLRQAPIFLASNTRTAAERDGRSVAARTELATRPATWQTLVVVTELPVDQPAAQAAVSDIDLHGSAQEVAERIARAVGSGSAGQWAAVARDTRSMM